MPVGLNLRIQLGFDGFWVILNGSNGLSYNLSDRAAEEPGGADEARAVRRRLELEFMDVGPTAWCEAHDLPIEALPGIGPSHRSTTDAEAWLREFAIDVTDYTPETVARATGAPWDLLDAPSLQLILRPSFHAEVVVTITRSGPEGAVARFNTAQCSLWALHNRDRQPFEARYLADEPPRPWRLSEALRIEDATAIWDAARTASKEDRAERVVLDGLAVTIRLRLPDLEVDIESHPPGPTDATGRLLDLVLALRQHLQTESIRSVLDDVNSYQR